MSTAEQLASVIADSYIDEPGPADPTRTLAEFVARKPDVDVEPLIASAEGALAPAGALMLAAGKASAGKTTFVVDLLLHAAAGVDYCGLTFARPLRILIVENEGPREAFRVKLEARLPHGPDAAEPIRVWDDPARWGMVRVSDEQAREQLRTIVVERRIDLVVADSLTRFGMSGNGTPEETRDFMLLLADAGLGRHVAFLILAHTRTRTDSDADELEQLAGAWAPHADAIVMLRKLDGNRARLSFPKARWTRGSVPTAILAFDPETETFERVATDAGDADKVSDDTYEQRIVEHLAAHPWATTDELDKGIEGRELELRKARRRLHEAGHITMSPSHELGLPGRANRWNLSSEAGSSPVPLFGTPQDGPSSDPSQGRNPVRGVPPLRGGTPGRTGLADGLDEWFDPDEPAPSGAADWAD